MSAKNPAKRGKGGARIYREKPKGRLPGAPHSAAERKAQTRAIERRKAGGVSKTTRKLAGLGADDVVDCFSDAVIGGDSSGVDQLAAQALGDLEVVRRGIMRDVRARGPVLTESIVSPASGEVVGERVKLHPGVPAVSQLSEQLGFTADHRRISPKSRGEGNRDEAVTAFLKRDRELRGAPPRIALPPPPEDEPIDVEVVKPEP